MHRSFRFSLFVILLLLLGIRSFAQQTQNFASHSVLAKGQWSRWAVSQTGIQKLSAADLSAAGWSLPVASDRIRVFGNGGRMLPETTSDPRPDDLTEIACEVIDQGDGTFDAPDDYLLFYARGPVVWSWDSAANSFLHSVNPYNSFSYYFLNLSDTIGKRVPVATDPGTPPDRVLTTFQDYWFHEPDSINLLKSGRNWFGEKFSSSLSAHFPVDIPQMVVNDTVWIRTTVAARAFDTTRFIITAWGQSDALAVVKVDPNINAEYVRVRSSDFKVISGVDPLTIDISYQPSDPNALGFLDAIVVNAPRYLVFSSGQLLFRNTQTLLPGVSRFDISGFNPQVRIWKVTRPENVVAMPVSVTSSGCLFANAGGLLDEFVMFDETGLPHPQFIETVANQDLHNHGFPDMIIVTHPDFRQQADRLADFRRTVDGLDVQVLEAQALYNEFSSGMQDPAAIRDYLRMLYLHAGSDSLRRPHYLLLFGDGSYDMKNRLQPNTNYIPTYQTANSILPTASFVSDDYFGLLDDGEGCNAAGSIDVGVGRLPAATPDEARTLVDKILRYNSTVDLLPPSSSPLPGQVSNFAAWRNKLTFIADDEDANLHFDQAEKLVAMVDTLSSQFHLAKIYLDAYQQEHTAQGDHYPGAHAALAAAFDGGSLLINYTGHGGETGLTDEYLLGLSDIHQMDNYMNLPVLITATCEFSRYDNPADVSAGEQLLLNPNGGVSAMLSTTRVAYANCNMIMNTHLLAAALEPGASRRIGDIIRIGKARCTPDVYMQNFTLLGDPAQRLTIPQYSVSLDSLNTDVYPAITDTLVAGTQLSLSGSVRDENDQVLTNFSGEVQAILFDKPATIYTLGNDAGSYITTFQDQQEILFSGRSTVSNGRFSFAFTLPADVSFRDGQARLSFYAKSIDRDAGGQIRDLPLVNTGELFTGNGEGPVISMFINDRGFTENGITSSDFTFLADLADPDGINFFGAGQGHDMLMVLDDDFVNPIVLNDYYQPQLNSAANGSLAYKMTGLAEGPHRIWLRGWDVLNFSSEKELNFIVKNNHEVSLNHVSANPNPTSGATRFCFDRNLTTNPQWARLIIRSLDGRILYEKESFFTPEDGISLCCNWDGNINNGGCAPAGLYVYSLRITDVTGTFREFTGTFAKIE